MATVAGRDLKREVEGMPVDLIGEFSRRTQAIESLIAGQGGRVRDGPGPGSDQRGAGPHHWLAWGETRRAKTHRSLGEMTDEWTERARPWVGERPVIVGGDPVPDAADLPVLRSDDLTDDMLADVARAALCARSEIRSQRSPRPTSAPMWSASCTGCGSPEASGPRWPTGR